MLLGIRHAAIIVSDLKKSLAFYRDTLGFRDFYYRDTDWAMLEIAGTSLSLIQGSPKPAPQTTSHPAHLGLNFSSPSEVDDLYKRLKKNTPPKTHRDGSYGFYFEDPDGNQFEAIFIPPLLNRESMSVILLAHGSHDPEWRKPFEKLRDTLPAQLPQHSWSLAYMEFATPTLRDLIQKQKGPRVLVIPLFFSAGAHVSRDIPAQVSECAKLRADLQIEVLPPIGSHPLFQQAILDTVCERVRESIPR